MPLGAPLQRLRVTFLEDVAVRLCLIPGMLLTKNAKSKAPKLLLLCDNCPLLWTAKDGRLVA